MYNGILLKLPAFEILDDKWIGHNNVDLIGFLIIV